MTFVIPSLSERVHFVFLTKEKPAENRWNFWFQLHFNWENYLLSLMYISSSKVRVVRSRIPPPRHCCYFGLMILCCEELFCALCPVSLGSTLCVSVVITRNVSRCCQRSSRAGKIHSVLRTTGLEGTVSNTPTNNSCNSLERFLHASHSSLDFAYK